MVNNTVSIVDGGLQLWTELGIVAWLCWLYCSAVIKAPNSFEKWLGALALVAAMLLPFSTMTGG
jgi:hypothetical protein